MKLAEKDETGNISLRILSKLEVKTLKVVQDKNIAWEKVKSLVGVSSIHLIQFEIALRRWQKGVWIPKEHCRWMTQIKVRRAYSGNTPLYTHTQSISFIRSFQQNLLYFMPKKAMRPSVLCGDVYNEKRNNMINNIRNSCTRRRKSNRIFILMFRI